LQFPSCVIARAEMARTVCNGQGKSLEFCHAPMARRNNEQRSLNGAAARRIRDFQGVVEPGAKAA